MSPFGIAIGIALVALAILSLRSLQFTWKISPWTSVGWAATALYCLYDLIRLLVQPEGGAFPILPHADYGLLILLTIAFIAAGVRDERQAEPWYWPTGRGPTRAERARKPRA
jgi:hypothetical protein